MRRSDVNNYCLFKPKFFYDEGGRRQSFDQPIDESNNIFFLGLFLRNLQTHNVLAHWATQSSAHPVLTPDFLSFTYPGRLRSQKPIFSPNAFLSLQFLNHLIPLPVRGQNLLLLIFLLNFLLNFPFLLFACLALLKDLLSCGQPATN